MAKVEGYDEVTSREVKDVVSRQKERRKKVMRKTGHNANFTGRRDFKDETTSEVKYS